MSDAPRGKGGRFTKGAGWTPEQAREAGKRGRAKQLAEAAGAIDEKVRRLLVDNNVAEPFPETLVLLAKNAVKGGASDMRLFLQQVGALVGSKDQYDGNGPCPTCGQTPGEGLVLAGSQFKSLGAALAELERLLTLSEELLEKERRIDP